MKTRLLYLIIMLAAVLGFITYLNSEGRRLTTSPTPPAAGQSVISLAAPPTETASSTSGPSDTKSCPSGMARVAGTYCPHIEYLCIKGYVCDRSPPEAQNDPDWCKTFPNQHAKLEEWPQGRLGIEYCEEYLPGHAVCKSPPMSRRTVDVCIDQFEFPNRKGELPTHNVNWYAARDACASVGKRLCQDFEWTVGCAGPKFLPFPYSASSGNWTRRGTCNTANKWLPLEELETAIRKKGYIEKSGTRPDCVSDYGIFDMTGNADEWVVNSDGKPYGSALVGGHSMANIRNRCGPKTIAHSEPSTHPIFGFRCCSDPK